jgi:hypothetical protein
VSRPLRIRSLRGQVSTFNKVRDALRGQNREGLGENSSVEAVKD